MKTPCFTICGHCNKPMNAASPSFSPLRLTSSFAFWCRVVGVSLMLCTSTWAQVQDKDWIPGQVIDKIYQSDPHEEVRKLLRRAKYDQALILVKKYVAVNPRDPQMRFWEAYIYEQMNQPALAMAANGEETRNPLSPLLTLEDVLGLKLNSDWVVLSACNTAAGDGKAEEALSGLARGFFYAGSRSLLVTHWSVESESAMRLTTRTCILLSRFKPCLTLHRMLGITAQSFNELWRTIVSLFLAACVVLK